MKDVYGLVLLVSWVAGVVIAKGFWATIAAIVLCPYAWYLSVEKIMQINGWL